MKQVEVVVDWRLESREKVHNASVLGPSAVHDLAWVRFPLRSAAYLQRTASAQSESARLYTSLLTTVFFAVLGDFGPHTLERTC